MIKLPCWGTEGGVAGASVITGVDTGCTVGKGVGIAVGAGMAVTVGEIVAEGTGVDAGNTVGDGNGVTSDTGAGTGNGETVAAPAIPAVVEFLMTIVVAGAFETSGPYVP